MFSRRLRGVALAAAAPLTALASEAWTTRGVAASAAPAAEHFDYLVIGGGSGGVASARRAAMHGKRVALVERGASWDEAGVRQGAGYGGTCVNVGCVPKKLMYTAASHFEAAETAPGYSIAMGEPKLDWTALVAKRDAYIARLNNIYTSNLDKAGIARVEGVATFVGPNAVAVGGRTLRADNVLIAVGGAPTMPRISGIEHCISSDGFFDLKTQPRRALVVGAGYIAVELAGILHTLGTKVDLACRGEGVLRHGFDPMIQDVLNAEIKRSGIGLRPKSQVASIRKEDDGTLSATYESGEECRGYDCVIFAIGRTPVTAGLGLETTGVQVTPPIFSSS